MKKIILITGGQRSGKSEYAERLALSLSDNPVYLATNIEEERQLSRHQLSGRVILIDCLTLWLTNLWYAEKPESADHGDGSDDPISRGNGITQNRPHDPRTLETAKAEFDRFTSQDATFIFVTNEIGCGGVSANAVQRRFTDLMGWMNQYVASQADEVILMVSGIPVKIK